MFVNKLLRIRAFWVLALAGTVRKVIERWALYRQEQRLPRSEEQKPTSIARSILSRGGTRLWVLLVIYTATLTVRAQHRFDQWTTDNGLPHNSIHAVRQTRDGYIWLTTGDGLVRFDGLHFRVFNKSNTPAISSNSFSVFTLHEDREGALWAGTWHGGVIRYKDGQFTSYTTKDGLPNNSVVRIDEDDEGTVWIFTNPGLTQWKQGRLIRVAPAPGSIFNDYLVAPPNVGVDGYFFGLWRRDAAGWQRFAYGRWSPFPTPPHLTDPARLLIGSIVEDSRRRVWYTSAERQGEHYCVSDGQLMIYRGLPHHNFVCYQDGAGRLWLTNHDGRTALWQQGRLVPLAGLSTPSIFRVLEDREGGLWVGTKNEGLYRLRPQAIIMHRHPGGPEFNHLRALLPGRDGTIWCGGSGLTRYSQGRFENFYRPGTQRWEFPNIVTALYEDPDGTLWVGTWEGVARFRAGRWLADPGPWSQLDGTINAIHRDRAGGLWFGTLAGLNCLRDGLMKHYTVADGLASNSVNTIYEDRAGSLWIGTTGGLARLADGRFTSFTETDGLSSNRVSAIHEDDAGRLWVGTFDGGLNRLTAHPEGMNITRYTTRDGLFNNSVYRIVEDDEKFFWLSSHLGLYRVRRQELDDFAAGLVSSITSTSFGKADGLANLECGSEGQPAGFKARDGSLWFPTQSGIAVIDRRHVLINQSPPPVRIEECIVDRQPIAFRDEVQVRPNQENLEIKYTALSFIKPDQLRFKYKLENLDRDWVEVGARRTAYYPHLPPGSYTFQVIAANSDGVWGAEAQRLKIRVLPYFYQTWWFVMLLSLGAAGLLLAGYWYRIRQLQRAQAKQQAFARQLIASQEGERKRIAGELHDSLGQHLVMIRNWALLGAGQLAAEAPAKEELDEITTTASRAISEVREIAYNLGPYHLERLGLADTIKGMVNRLAQASPICFSTELEQLNGLLSREAEMTLYRIAQEALNNLIKHAEATEAKVWLRREADGVRLTITDNGKGFHSQAAAAASPGAGGFGLTNISERVRLLGGSWVIDSAPGQGTSIEVTLGVKDRR